METAGSDQFVTDSELDRYLNDALAELYDMLLQAWGDGYAVATTTLALVSGTASYALPADFYKLRSVVVDDGSSYHQTPRFRWNDLARLEQYSGGSGGTSIYHLHYGLNTHADEQLTFKPTPQDSYTATVHYVPKYTELTAATDTVSPDVNNWSEWAVLGAAIQMLNKEESYEQSQMLEQQRMRIEQRIRNLAGNRDAGRPHRIEDTRRDYYGGEPFTVSGLSNDWEW